MGELSQVDKRSTKSLMVQSFNKPVQLCLPGNPFTLGQLLVKQNWKKCGHIL